jgi:hypothetical protein
MKKIVCVLAVLAGASTAAVAKDLKQDKRDKTSGVSATQMSDAEMDKVTAGTADAAAANVTIYNPGQVYVDVLNNSRGQAELLPFYPGGRIDGGRICLNSCFY